jgi:hypothetical protein
MGHGLGATARPEHDVRRGGHRKSDQSDHQQHWTGFQPGPTAQRRRDLVAHPAAQPPRAASARGPGVPTRGRHRRRLRQQVGRVLVNFAGTLACVVDTPQPCLVELPTQQLESATGSRRYLFL